jgi:hypothetical protein
MSSASTGNTYHKSILQHLVYFDKHVYKNTIINTLHAIFVHYEDKYKDVQNCNVKILKDCKNMLDEKSWGKKGYIENCFTVFLGQRSYSLFKRIFDAEAAETAFNIVTHTVIGNPVAIAYNLLKSCYKVGLSSIKHRNKKIQIAQTSNEIANLQKPCGDKLTMTPSKDEMTKICSDFSTLVNLLTSNGTMKEAHELSRNVFLLSLLTFIQLEVEDILFDFNGLISYYDGRYGVLMTLSEMYNVKQIQDNYIASSLVKDIFNVVANNLFEKREDSSINLATSISYSSILSTKIKDKYDMDVDDILEPSGIYDSLYLYLIHMIHHDENNTLKHILTTFQYIEFQDPGEATFELISHINTLVCSEKPVICKTKKNAGIVGTFIKGTSSSQSSDRRFGGSGSQANKMMFVLTFAVLVASSLVGTLQ